LFKSLNTFSYLVECDTQNETEQVSIFTIDEDNNPNKLYENNNFISGKFLFECGSHLLLPPFQDSCCTQGDEDISVDENTYSSDSDTTNDNQTEGNHYQYSMPSQMFDIIIFRFIR
jgi:hypothetical protein